MPTTPSRKTKDGLKGIVSALAFSPSYSPDESFFAAGSFTPTTHNIAMFSDAQSDPLMYLGGGPQAGVTQVSVRCPRVHRLWLTRDSCASIRCVPISYTQAIADTPAGRCTAGMCGLTSTSQSRSSARPILTTPSQRYARIRKCISTSTAQGVSSAQGIRYIKLFSCIQT